MLKAFDDVSQFSCASLSMPFSEDDELSEIDDDFFFLFQPTEDTSELSSNDMAKGPTHRRVPAEFNLVMLEVLDAEKNDCQLRTIEEVRQSSLTHYDESCFTVAVSHSLPTHPVSPAGVARYGFDPFVAKEEILISYTEMSAPESDHEDEDDNATSLEGLYLDGLDLYFDEDDEKEDRSGQPSKYIIFPDELNDMTNTKKTFFDVFASLISCLNSHKR